MKTKIKIDLTRFNKILNEIKDVKTALNADKLKEVREVSKDLEVQIVNLCKKTHSEANYAVYDMNNPLLCFEVFNSLGTSLAYVWFDDLGYADVIDNTLTYEQRMN